MTGLAGGPLAEGTLERMTDAFWSEPWYEDRVLSADGLAVGHRHHGERDPNGPVTWRGGRPGGGGRGERGTAGGRYPFAERSSPSIDGDTTGWWD